MTELIKDNSKIEQRNRSEIIRESGVNNISVTNSLN
jgi:hypothetical protein